MRIKSVRLGCAIVVVVVKCHLGRRQIPQELTLSVLVRGMGRPLLPRALSERVKRMMKVNGTGCRLPGPPSPMPEVMVRVRGCRLS